MDIIDPMRIVFGQRAVQAPTQKNAPASHNLYEGPTTLWFHGVRPHVRHYRRHQSVGSRDLRIHT